MHSETRIDLRTITCRPEGFEHFGPAVLDAMVSRVEKIFESNPGVIVPQHDSVVVFEYRGNLVGLRTSQPLARSAAKCLSLLQEAKRTYEAEQFEECMGFLIGAAQEFVNLDVLIPYELFERQRNYHAMQKGRSKGGRNSALLSDEQWNAVFEAIENRSAGVSKTKASIEISRQLRMGVFFLESPVEVSSKHILKKYRESQSNRN